MPLSPLSSVIRNVPFSSPTSQSSTQLIGQSVNITITVKLTLLGCLRTARVLQLAAYKQLRSTCFLHIQIFEYTLS